MAAESVSLTSLHANRPTTQQLKKIIDISGFVGVTKALLDCLS